jgi:hypothetical protein
MSNLKNIAEKIYMLCYEKPLLKSEIEIRLYGKANKYVSTITNLKKSSKYWKISDKDGFPVHSKKILKKCKDGRKISGKFCYSKPNILMESIVNQLGVCDVFLDDDEYDLVFSYISSDEFRRYVGKHLEKFNIREYPIDFYPLKEALGHGFYTKYFIDGIIKNKLNAKKEEIIEYHENYTKARHLLPGYNEYVKRFSTELIKKLACLSPSGNKDINFLYDIFSTINDDLDRFISKR